jgi:hypothetical protein
MRSASFSGGRRLALAAGITAVAVTGVAGLASAALFTDSDTIGGNSATTGTVILDTATPTKTAWDIPNMAPGDVELFTVDVINKGSLGLRYAISSTSDNKDNKGLAEQLDAAVAFAADAKGCQSADFVRAAAYTGPLSALSLGSKATGSDDGDRDLKAGASEVMCVQLSLDSATTDEFQQATTGTTLTFDTEQTANNA